LRITRAKNRPIVLYGAKNMNMISTGTFLNGMDASNKQSKLVKKLVTAWEKKNSKAARAGGVSLMALSLAACGEDDTTPFAQSDIDAATSPLTAAVAAAETALAAAQADAASALVAQAAAETQAAEALVAQAAAEAAAAAATVAGAANTAALATATASLATAEAALATANAEKATLQTTYDALVASNTTLQGQYDALVAPVSAVLTTAATDVVNGRTGNDSITGTNLTLNAGDLITDSSPTDSDVMTISIDNADLGASAIVTGIETVTVNLTSILAGATPLELAIDLANYSGLNVFNVNATNASTLVNSVQFDNADSSTINADTEFLTVDIDADNNASFTVNAASTTMNVTADAAGANVTDLTVVNTATGAGTIGTDADGTVTVTTSGDTTVTANDAANVTVTSAARATVNASDVLANAVSVTAGEEAIVTANAAETVTISAGDGIDAASAAAIDSSLTSSNTNSITANLSGNGAAANFDLTGATTVNNVAISGDQNVTVSMSMATVDGLGSTTAATTDDNLVTITDTSTGTSTLSFTAAGGDVDTSSAQVDVVNVGADLGANDDITVASGTTVTVSVDQATADLSIVAKVPTATDNSVNITAANDLADADDLNGITLSNFATATVTAADATTAASLGAVTAAGTNMTIEGGARGFDTVGAINLGTGVLTINGAAAFSMGTVNVTAASVQAGNATGVITIDLNGAGTTGTVVTGSANDVLSTSGAARTAGDYVISTGAGDDAFTLGIDEGYTLDMGTGTDTITINAALDLSDNVISFSGVENIATTNNTDVLTMGAAGFATDNIFNLNGQAGGTDGIVVSGTANSDNVDMSFVVATNAALTINGGGSADTLTGSSASITTVNGDGGNDTITGGAAADVLNGGAGNDTISTGAGGDTVTGGAGNDTVTGGAGADTITGGAGADTLAGGAAGDTYVVNTGEVVAGDSISEAAGIAGTDTIRADTATDLTALTVASFDNIEAIDMDVDAAHVTVTGLQVTGETINVIGSGGGGADNLTINMGIGETGVFTNVAMGAATGAAILINGATGAETITSASSGATITGGAGADTITSGAGADTIVLATGSSDTINSFTVGAGGDVVGGLTVPATTTGAGAFKAITAVGAEDFGADGVFAVRADTATAGLTMTAAQVEAAVLNAFTNVGANEVAVALVTADTDAASDVFIYSMTANAGGSDITAVELLGVIDNVILDNLTAANIDGFT